LAREKTRRSPIAILPPERARIILGRRLGEQDFVAGLIRLKRGAGFLVSTLRQKKAQGWGTGDCRWLRRLTVAGG